MPAEQATWDTVSFRSLCLETTTLDPTKSPDTVFEYVDVSSISNELWKIVSSTRHTGATAPSRARKVVRAEDVIFATVRPTLKRVALVPPELDGQVVSTAFCVLRADPIKADPRFIYYSLLTEDFINQVSNLERGASYPAVTDNDVLGREVSVPLLPEQRAIAAVLSKIQAVAEVQEKIVTTLKELKAAAMAKLFREGLRGEPLKQTEIGEIPESWEVVPCEAICEMISVGIVVTPAKYYVPAGVPCFRSLNIQEDRLIEDNFVFISEAANDLHAKSKLHAGDVVIVRSGYPGTACVVPQKYDGVNCIDLIIARPNRRRVLSDYLSRYINSPAGKRQIMFGQGGLAQQHFNIGAMKRFLVALPSMDDQSAISAIGSALDGKIANAEMKLASLKATFSSMLHLLMTGQVRVRELIGVKDNLQGMSETKITKGVAEWNS